MRLVFVEASLETVPKEIAYHAQVIKASRIRGKKPENMLLEDYLHYRAMKKLDKSEKRGRPDIIHRCLLLCLDSNVDNLFSEIYVHTLTGKIIWVNPEVRLPRTYERFRGLMEKLFTDKRVVTDTNEVLLKLTDLSLEDVLKGRVVVLREKGNVCCKEGDVCERIKKAGTVCIGAFPHGDFEKETLEIFSEKKAEFISFSRKSYTSLYALCRTICCLLR